MAMNKAEKAQLQQARELAALNWTYPPEPIDLKPIRDAERAGKAPTAAIVAWWFNAYTGAVGRGVTQGSFHSISNTTKTDRQGAGGPWFNTEVDALKAMRAAIERDAARRLAQIDQRIADTIAAGIL